MSIAVVIQKKNLKIIDLYLIYENHYREISRNKKSVEIEKIKYTISLPYINRLIQIRLSRLSCIMLPCRLGKSTKRKKSLKSESQNKIPNFICLISIIFLFLIALFINNSSDFPKNIQKTYSASNFP